MNFFSLPLGGILLSDSTNQMISCSLDYINPFKFKIFYNCFDFIYNYIYIISILATTIIFLNTQLSESKSWLKFLVFLRLAAKTLLGFLLLCYMLPIAAPFCLVSFIISKIVRRKYLRDPSYSDAMGLDAIWGIDLDSPSRPFITVLLTMEGKPEIDKIKVNMNKLLNEKNSNGEYRFRKFRQNLVKRYNFWLWRDVETFDIYNHLKLVDVGKALGKENLDEFRKSEEEENIILHYISDPEQAPISLEHPQWEIVVCDTGDDNSYSIILRFHHGIADGISLLRLFLEKMIDNPYHFGDYKRNQTFLQKLMTQLWAIPLSPYSLIPLIFRGGNNVLHGPTLTGNKIFVSSPIITLADLRKLKVASKTGVTDILFSCLSAALGKYFHKKGCSDPDMMICFPVGYNDTSAPLILKNVFGMAITKFSTVNRYSSLATPLKSDSGIRLKEIKTIFDGIRSDPSVLALYYASTLIANLSPDALIKILFRTDGLTMGVSNMPGPARDLFIGGDKLKALRFWVPDRAPTGAGFTMLSYKDDVRVSFNVDRAIINDRKEAQLIIDDFMAEIDNLKREFCTKTE